LSINGELALTTSRDVLQAVGEGRGPEQVLVSLGYAGWAPGQLEQELSQNAWLTVAARAEVIFDTPPEGRFAAAMDLLGVDPTRLSDEVGHA
jgi:putative transcriptional regulator